MVILNTSPLIALDRIGCLEILPKLFGHITRPQSVVDELLAGRNIYGGSELLFNADWITTVEDPVEMVLRKELGAGETAVIALAVRMKADLVVLDDLAARNVAVELGLNISGTLGLILAAYKKGILNDVQTPLDALVSCGFRISEKVIQAALNGSNE